MTTSPVIRSTAAEDSGVAIETTGASYVTWSVDERIVMKSKSNGKIPTSTFPLPKRNEMSRFGSANPSVENLLVDCTSVPPGISTPTGNQRTKTMVENGRALTILDGFRIRDRGRGSRTRHSEQDDAREQRTCHYLKPGPHHRLLTIDIHGGYPRAIYRRFPRLPQRRTKDQQNLSPT
jgi:hypothetical protein